MQRTAVWCGLGASLLFVGCHRVAQPTAVPPPAHTAAAAVNAAAEVVGAAPAAAAGLAPNSTPAKVGQPAIPGQSLAPKPRQYAPKEIVIAWEASLMYLLKDGKPTGKPIILNGALAKYFRPAHLGNFRITEKERMKRSNLYDVHGDPLPDKEMAETNGAVMRNWMRLGSLPVGLHFSPAFRFQRAASRRHRSHGCWRMGRRDSDMVFKWAPLGTPIHVVRSLGGSEWAFLLERTPAELLPGYKPTRTAKHAPASVASRSRASRRASRKPVASTPTAAAKKPTAPPPAASTAPSGLESGHLAAPPAPPTEPESKPASEPQPAPNPGAR